MCAFNSQYGYVMTHACRQAKVLNKIFNKKSYKLKDISHIFNKQASKISDECWLISTTSDWKILTLKLIKTDKYGRITTYERGAHFNSIATSKSKLFLMIRFMQWYTRWFIQCTSKFGQLATDFINVVDQYKSPFY